MKKFKERVLEVVANIPKGQVLTYKQVAKLSLSPNAFRAVGSILKKNFDPNIPCHRVIRSDGYGRYNRGDDLKVAKLKSEGVILKTKMV
jgi:O-6-methylguanine DNA methyltransferase